MPGFQSPNHTQIPNDLFDLHLPNLGHAELKILLAILRETLGFHRRKKRLSITAIQKLTGLARSSVQAGCDSLAETGLVTRIKDGGVTQWVVNWNDDPPDVAVLGVPDTSIAGFQPVPKSNTPHTGNRYSPIPKIGTPSTKETIKKTKSNKLKRGDRPPAVELCKRIIFRYPHKALWKTIDRQVGRDFGSLLKWGRLLRYWKLNNWNPTNYKGMLDAFSRDGIKVDDFDSLKHRRRFAKTWTQE